MKQDLSTLLFSFVVACAPLTLFLVLLDPIPAIEPGLFWMVPLGVAAGFSVLWRRNPKNAYPIGLVFVPIVGALLGAITVFIWWNVLGGYI